MSLDIKYNLFGRCATVAPWNIVIADPLSALPIVGNCDRTDTPQKASLATLTGEASTCALNRPVPEDNRKRSGSSPERQDRHGPSQPGSGAQPLAASGIVSGHINQEA